MTKPAVTNRDIRDDLRKLADNDASAAADRASIKGALNSIRSVQDAQHEVQDAQYESVAADFVDNPPAASAHSPLDDRRVRRHVAPADTRRLARLGQSCSQR